MRVASWIVLGGMVMALAGSTVARAACPDALCDCIGAAQNFDVLASDNLTISFGKISYSGYSYRVPVSVSAPSCGRVATIAGADDAFTEVGDIVALATSGIGIKFKAVKISGVVDPGTEVIGDVATGGSTVIGQDLAILDGGPPDTSGTHPLLASCNQAISDLTTNAGILAALTPDQSPLKILANNGSDGPVVLDAGPGRTVISSPSVVVSPRKVSGYPEGSELTINMDADATLVVINTPKLSVGTQCAITVSGPGADPSRVVLNVTSTKGVKIGKEASIDPVVLAMQSAVTVNPTAETSSIYGRKTTVRGAEVGGVLSCSPSGAFLDDATF